METRISKIKHQFLQGLAIHKIEFNVSGLEVTSKNIFVFFLLGRLQALRLELTRIASRVNDSS